MADIERMGIIGAGNMGGSMLMGFAEQGIDVSIWDINPNNVDRAMKIAKAQDTLEGSISGFHDVQDFMKSFGDQRKLLVFSISHGSAADSVLDKIRDNLEKDDIILDGGNEHYRSTERRQRDLEPKGIHWIGMGVSGGYQSARRGPSMSPGGDHKAVEDVLPLLEKFAAKDPKTGRPCVANIGPRGAGHYVKMVHNGIENGFLSTVSEAWSILHKSLGLPNDAIGQIFEKWNSTGTLKNTYLIQIGSEIAQRKRTPDGDGHGEGQGTNGYVLDDVLDKVVQDDDSSEGTLFWSVAEAANRHVAAPTHAAGQFLRVASGDRDQRVRVAEKLRIPAPSAADMADKDKDAFVETLRQAVYTSLLAGMCQGLELIARASKDEGWNVDLATVIRVWRAGCIIQEEHIADILEPIFAAAKEPVMNIKLVDEVAADLHEGYAPLKEVVLKATLWDNYVPSLSASLEYLKYCGGEALPTQYMEAEMDFFGAHSFDRPGVEGEDPGKAKKGAHHYEWRPA